MKRFSVTFCILHFAFCIVRAQLPDTDIWLLDVSEVKGKFDFSNPVNITNRKGYDNQPAFSPDGKYILYTSIRDSSQSDIYKYDIASKQTSQFTNTPTSEYSPTFMPDGKSISVVMVEKDSAQRLWSFPLKKGKPERIMEMDSIGYHCWYSENTLGVFVLTHPFTLQLAYKNGDKARILDDSIGRCIKKYGSQMYYTTKTSDGKNYLHCFNLPGLHTSRLFEMPGEDFVMRNGLVITSSGSKLFISAMNGTWVELWNLASMGVGNLGRIALSPDGKKIAVVSVNK